MFKKSRLLFSISLSVLAFITACNNSRECPDGMEECEIQNGTVVCVPKGSC